MVASILLYFVSGAEEDDVPVYLAQLWQDQLHVPRDRETCERRSPRVRS